MKEEKQSNIQLLKEKKASMQLLKEEKVGIQLSKEEKVGSNNQLIKAFDPNLQLHWMKMDMLTKKVVRASILYFVPCIFKYFSAAQYSAIFSGLRIRCWSMSLLLKSFVLIFDF